MTQRRPFPSGCSTSSPSRRAHPSHPATAEASPGLVSEGRSGALSHLHRPSLTSYQDVHPSPLTSRHPLTRSTCRRRCSPPAASARRPFPHRLLMATSPASCRRHVANARGITATRAEHRGPAVAAPAGRPCSGSSRTTPPGSLTTSARDGIRTYLGGPAGDQFVWRTIRAAGPTLAAAAQTSPEKDLVEPRWLSTETTATATGSNSCCEQSR